MSRFPIRADLPVCTVRLPSHRRRRTRASVLHRRRRAFLLQPDHVRGVPQGFQQSSERHARQQRHGLRGEHHLQVALYDDHTAESPSDFSPLERRRDANPAGAMRKRSPPKHQAPANSPRFPCFRAACSRLAPELRDATRCNRRQHRSKSLPGHRIEHGGISRYTPPPAAINIRPGIAYAS